MPTWTGTPGTGDLGNVSNLELRGPRPWVDVRAYGLTDVGLQAAHDALPLTGGKILIPPDTIVLLAAEVSFTKPVILQGGGRGSSELVLTSNASTRDAIHSTDTLVVRDLTIRTQTAPVTNLSMAGIRVDAKAAGGVGLIVENVEIRDFNFGVFADGRDIGGQDFDLDYAIVRNCVVRVSSAAGAVSPGIFLAGARQAIVEGCAVNNQDLGDHNVYLIRNHLAVVRDNWLRNTGTSGGLCAVKLVTELAGDSGTLGGWYIENNVMESNSLPILVSLTGSIVLPLCRISGNAIRTARSTTAGDGGAVKIVLGDTAILEALHFIGGNIDDTQLGCVKLDNATGATLKSAYFIANRMADWSNASSGTYSAIVSGSLGTYSNVVVVGLEADGELTGRQAFDLASAARVQVVDVRETNTTLTSTGTFRIGPSGTGVAERRWNAAASVADGGTIAHGLGATPTVAIAQSTVAGEFASITAKDATNITVAIKKHDGTAGTSQTIYWFAER